MYNKLALSVATALVLIGTTLAGADNEPTKADIPPGASAKVKGLIEQTFSDDAQKREKAAKELGTLGPTAVPAIPFLIRLLNDGALVHNGWAVGWRAGDALRKIGVPSVGPCIEALHRSSGENRSAIISLLADFNDPRAIETLAGVLSDPDVSVRQRGSQALAESLAEHSAVAPRPVVIPALLKALKDSDASVRCSAIIALGAFHDPPVIEPLIPLLKDKDKAVCWQAINALGASKTSKAVPFLLEIMHDPKRERRFRAEAALALGEVGDKSAIEPLLKVLNNNKEHDSVRAYAVYALGTLDAKSAMEPLFTHLNDPVERIAVRAAAARAIGLLHDRRASEPFMAILHDRRVPVVVRRAVVDAVAKLLGRDAIPLLSQLAKNDADDWEVRYDAAFSLTELTAGAIDDMKVLDVLIEYHDEGVDRDFGYHHQITVLRSIVKNGKTAEIREAARNMRLLLKEKEEE